MGDWNNPYLTYSVPYVKNQLKQFYKLYNKKLIYRDVKPVYWSPSSRYSILSVIFSRILKIILLGQHWLKQN